MDNNIENVNTPSPGGDDSGAFGFLIHGDHNLFSRNTVRGSVARSYDWVWDGGAFEIYDGDHNTITGNLAVDNNNFSELGHSKKQSAVVGNVFTRNTIRATCASCSEARGLIVRGAKVKYGPEQRDGVLRQHGAADRPDGAWRHLPRRLQPRDPDHEEQRDHGHVRPGVCRLERRGVPPARATC